jgi:dihydroflavonol-4-reductase
MSWTLVTGGTGFLGSHVVRQLVARGERVRVLARGSSEPLPEGAEKIAGDVVRDLPGGVPLQKALEGCERVYHLAGFVSRDPDEGQRMMRVHIDGTRRLLDAAAGRRVVVASTSGTIAVSREPAPIADESAPYATEVVSNWAYYLSKIYQEKLALTYQNVVVVNPSLLLGPGDERQSSTGDVKKFLRQQIPIVPPGGLNFVDARDAAAATVTAMDKGRAGERYLLGGPNWSFADFFGRLSRASKVRGPRLRLPDKLTLGATTLLEHAYKALHKQAPVDRISVEMSQVYWYCDSGKAERELGFVARDPGA